MHRQHLAHSFIRRAARPILYCIGGPYLPEQGHRFNRHKPLLDPYTKALTGGPNFTWDFNQSFDFDHNSPSTDLSFSTSTHLAGMPKCIVYGDDGFDWQGDRPLNRRDNVYGKNP